MAGPFFILRSCDRGGIERLIERSKDGTNNNNVSELKHEQDTSKSIFTTTRTSHYVLSPYGVCTNNRCGLNGATPHNQSSGVMQGVLSLVIDLRTRNQGVHISGNAQGLQQIFGIYSIQHLKICY